MAAPNMNITFAKAPLIEIIAELRWIPQGSTPLQLADSSNMASPTVFVGGSKQEEFYMRLGAEIYKFDFSRSERVTPAGMPFMLHQPVYRFRSEAKDKSSVIYQVGYGIFSVHGIPPYHSWDTFLPFVKNGFEVLLKSRADTDVNERFSQVSLRYIDFFGEELMQGRDISTFVSENLGFSMPIPSALTEVASSSQVKTLLHRITLPTEVGDLVVSVGDGVFNNQAGVLLDSITSATNGTAPDLGEIMRVFDSAYRVIHKMFFRLTKPLHALMEPRE